MTDGTPPERPNGAADRLLTIVEVADRLQVDPITVRRAIARGGLRTVTLEEAAERPDDHWVYLAYAGDALLYVGITACGADRLRQHAGDTPWTTTVTRFEIEHHPTRAAAAQRERELIRELRPQWNRSGLGGPTRIRESELNRWLDTRATRPRSST